jgi:hypothetical protein
MTNYTPPRSGQDLNHFMASSPLTFPQYPSSDNGNYNYHSHTQYENVSPAYSAYSNSYVSSQNQSPNYISDNLQMATQYPYSSTSLGASFTHHRPLAQTAPYSLQHISQNHLPQYSRYAAAHDLYQPSDIESQESVNEDTMQSEAVFPPLEGFPDLKAFDQLIKMLVLF